MYLTSSPLSVRHISFMTHLFYGRFRMRRHVFERLVDVVLQVDPYFIQRPNYAGEIGLSALQKVVAAV
jgi:hypothetical protein